MTERPDDEAARAQDEWDASLPHENGLLQTPAPERPDLAVSIAQKLWRIYIDRDFFQGNDHRALLAAETDARDIDGLVAAMSPAAPAPDAGLDVERLAQAYALTMHHPRVFGGDELVANRIAAEYAALSRQAETARVVTTRRADPIVISESDFGPVHGAEKE